MSSLNYLSYAYDQVPFSIVSGGCQSNYNSGASSGTPWFDAGLTVCSITIIFTSLALTPYNFAVQPGHETINLNALPGKWPYTDIFPVWEVLI